VGSIKHRRQLKPYAKDHPLHEISFYYEEQTTPIDMNADRVGRTAYGTPPVLLGPNGKPKVFPTLIAARWKMIKDSTNLHVDFEGGMGDQVMQLEAVKTLALLLPRLNIEIGLHQNYQQIAPYLEHNGEYTTHGKPPARLGFNSYVNQSTHFITDPRGGLHGKACLYGANLGIEEVRETINLNFPPKDAWARISASGLFSKTTAKPLLGIHARSASGGAKSWNHEHALALATLWHQTTKGGVFLCGPSTDYTCSSPLTFTVPPSSDWVLTGAIIQNLNLLVAIDSGPMHLARSANIPLITLWGGTGPEDILGRQARSTDLRASLPCTDNICYSCPKGTSACMKALTPSVVWKAIEQNFPELLRESTVIQALPLGLPAQSRSIPQQLTEERTP
jgi:hypothetical protein